MTTQKLFTDEQAWLGGYYELALELGPRSDRLLTSGITRLWEHPALDGCYLARDLEPDRQKAVAPCLLPESGFLYGVLRLPNGKQVACGSCIIREDDGPDWLTLGIPMGSLGTAYPVDGYPFNGNKEQDELWRPDLDQWLADLGAWIAAAVPFQLGLVGHEVSCEAYAAQVAKTGVPAERFFGYLWPGSAGLEYHPLSMNWFLDGPPKPVGE